MSISSSKKTSKQIENISNSQPQIEQSGGESRNNESIDIETSKKASNLSNTDKNAAKLKPPTPASKPEISNARKLVIASNQRITSLSKKVSELLPRLIPKEQDLDISESVILPADSANAFPKPQKLQRYLKWTALAIVILLLVVPLGLWIHYQSVNIMSRNAMVRGNLAELGSRLSGILSDIEVAEGERVIKDQVLARLEDRHIQSEALQVQAELEGLVQELQVEQLAIAHKQRSLDNKLLEAVANQKAAKAEVTAARSRANNARQSHEMRKSLLSSNAISREVVRDAEAKRRTEQAMVNVAKANHTAALSVEAAVRLESEGLQIRTQRIEIIKANILRAKAKLERVNADLDSSLIRAPDNGAIVRWLVQLGGSVKVGIPVVSMWLGKDVWVEAWIDEDDIAKVKIGSKALVTLQSFPGQEFNAVIDKIGLTTDFQLPESDDFIPQPRFARLRGAPVVGVLVRLVDPPKQLLPGLSAIVAIHIEES